MAKVPKMVSKTSGQGVSRKSYQTGRSLGMRGTGSPGGGVKAMSVSNPDMPTAGMSGGKISGKQDYGKLPPPLYSEREDRNPTLSALGAIPANKSKAAKGFVF